MTPKRINQKFKLIVDMTGFTQSAQLPIQWLRIVSETTPYDLHMYLETVYFLNINTSAYRYLRRLWNLSAG